MANKNNQRRGKKEQKRKNKRKQQRKQTGRGGHVLEKNLLRDGLAGSLLNAHISGDSEGGMRLVYLWRACDNDTALLALFKVDTFCTGIKNTFIRCGPMEEYHRIDASEDVSRVEPAYAKKLIEESVTFARRFGLEPHKDFEQAFKAFHDIDSDGVELDIEFGMNGKPFFIAGPDDTDEYCHRVMRTVAEHTEG